MAPPPPPPVPSFRILSPSIAGLLARRRSPGSPLPPPRRRLPDELEAAVRERGLTAEQVDVAVNTFWKAERARLHDALAQRTVWNGALKRMQWRVDIKSAAGSVGAGAAAAKPPGGEGEPTAIVEMAIARRDGQPARGSTEPGGAESEVVRFEMSREQLHGVLNELEAIQKALAAQS